MTSQYYASPVSQYSSRAALPCRDPCRGEPSGRQHHLYPAVVPKSAFLEALITLGEPRRRRRAYSGTGSTRLHCGTAVLRYYNTEVARTLRSRTAMQPMTPSPTCTHRATVIAVVNQKGGVAKTTSVIHLGVAIAELQAGASGRYRQPGACRGGLSWDPRRSARRRDVSSDRGNQAHHRHHHPERPTEPDLALLFSDWRTRNWRW